MPSVIKNWLSSPNGNQTVVFRQNRCRIPVELCYQVTYKGIPVVEKSVPDLIDNRIWEMALGVRNLKQPGLLDGQLGGGLGHCLAGRG